MSSISIANQVIMLMLSGRIPYSLSKIPKPLECSLSPSTTEKTCPFRTPILLTRTSFLPMPSLASLSTRPGALIPLSLDHEDCQAMLNLT